MDDGSPLARAVGADGGQQRGGAGADILTEQDEDNASQIHYAAGGHGLYDADGGGRGLDDGGEYRARQNAQDGVGEFDHQLGKFRHILERRHSAGHGVHTGEQQTEANNYRAHLLHHFSLEHHHHEHTDKNGNGCQICLLYTS